MADEALVDIDYWQAVRYGAAAVGASVCPPWAHDDRAHCCKECGGPIPAGAARLMAGGIRRRHLCCAEPLVRAPDYNPFGPNDAEAASAAPPTPLMCATCYMTYDVDPATRVCAGCAYAAENPLLEDKEDSPPPAALQRSKCALPALSPSPPPPSPCPEEKRRLAAAAALARLSSLPQYPTP